MKTVRNLVVAVVVVVLMVLASPKPAYADLTTDQFCSVYDNYGVDAAYGILMEYNFDFYYYVSGGGQILLDEYYATLGPMDNPDYSFMWVLMYDWGTHVFNQECHGGG